MGVKKLPPRCYASGSPRSILTFSALELVGGSLAA
ncbi:hypothetical protein N825_27055 [Skermanella stibiiresistens SB22]|uniref:Uncharacterized protein n=1 Tax=Skermanella stibiiresistens SB22 TaxID=1385369 RepID=W9GVD6_9PROT|nr:hypothetical protein N825_27055 [Skermanella stibiiresistens SB22]